ncbi:hypothetical protein, partial [Mucilaginibacter arboris]|uniref:hypothetical protein n=1 Tax=Mucilaginibacter arboris TaxID=2682090 RepID=UPI001E3264D8
QFFAKPFPLAAICVFARESLLKIFLSQKSKNTKAANMGSAKNWLTGYNSAFVLLFCFSFG